MLRGTLIQRRIDASEKALKKLEGKPAFLTDKKLRSVHASIRERLEALRREKQLCEELAKSYEESDTLAGRLNDADDVIAVLTGDVARIEEELAAAKQEDPSEAVVLEYELGQRRKQLEEARKDREALESGYKTRRNGQATKREEIARLHSRNWPKTDKREPGQICIPCVETPVPSEGTVIDVLANGDIVRLMPDGVLKIGREIEIVGDSAFQEKALGDLKRIAATKQGRKTLEKIRRHGKTVTILPPTLAAATRAAQAKIVDHCFSPTDGWVTMQDDPKGRHVKVEYDATRKVNVVRTEQPKTVTGKGKGAESMIVYDPAAWPTLTSPQTPADVILLHELSHAGRSAAGESKDQLSSRKSKKFRDKWFNYEEHLAVRDENSYRGQRTPPRKKRKDYVGGNP